MNAQQTKPAPLCKCGARATYQEYMTFSFYVCKTCKVEVGGKAAKAEPKEEPEKWALITPQSIKGYQPITPTLPLGMSALHGEAVACYDCNKEVGTLLGNLPSAWTPGRWSAYKHILYTQSCACPISSELKYDAVSGNSLINVVGRGWV